MSKQDCRHEPPEGILSLPATNQDHAQALTAFALTYPEAHEDHPWGDLVVKVRGKIFVFLHGSDEVLSVTAKLPQTGVLAFMLPFASPARYRLGQSGWVTARFTAEHEPSLEMLRAWIDESYRAVAPKRLVATLPASSPVPEAPAKPRGRGR